MLGQGGLGRGGERQQEQEEHPRGGGGGRVGGGGGGGESDSSRGWQPPREQDAGLGRADAATLCAAAGLGLGVVGSVSTPSDWRPGATAPRPPARAGPWEPRLGTPRSVTPRTTWRSLSFPGFRVAWARVGVWEARGRKRRGGHPAHTYLHLTNFTRLPTNEELPPSE